MRLHIGRYAFRPRLWASLFTLAALLILIALSCWQFQRLAWKTALIAEIETGLSAPPAPFPAEIADPQDWQYRRLSLEGQFDHNHMFRLKSRVWQGRVGEHLLTPLITEQRQVVLVNRGWIPMEETAPLHFTKGPIRITGIAQIPPAPDRFTPRNDPAAGDWYWIDLPAMAQAAGYDSFAPLILYADAEDMETFPIGGQARITLPQNHLQYALTWALFALTLLVIYIIYHTKRLPP